MATADISERPTDCQGRLYKREYLTKKSTSVAVVPKSVYIHDVQVCVRMHDTTQSSPTTRWKIHAVRHDEDRPLCSDGK
jgi:hypothetical protein